MTRACSSGGSTLSRATALLGCVALAAGVWAAAPGSSAAEAAPQVFLIDAAVLLKTRRALEARDERFTKPRDRLIQEAARALGHAPVSVTEKAILPPSGDRHDYMSLAPYLWPNPATPTGLPYVVRDGETNPERKSIPDEAYLVRTISHARVLTLAYFFSGNSAYAEHAAQILRVFFLDPATRMNPSLTYARSSGAGRGRTPPGSSTPATWPSSLMPSGCWPPHRSGRRPTEPGCGAGSPNTWTGC
jgi:hypothetical protein